MWNENVYPQCETHELLAPQVSESVQGQSSGALKTKFNNKPEASSLIFFNVLTFVSLGHYNEVWTTGGFYVVKKKNNPVY